MEPMRRALLEKFCLRRFKRLSCKVLECLDGYFKADAMVSRNAFLSRLELKCLWRTLDIENISLLLCCGISVRSMFEPKDNACASEVFMVLECPSALGLPLKANVSKECILAKVNVMTSKAKEMHKS